MKCPKCHRANVVKHGGRENRIGPVQKYLCRDCGGHFTVGGHDQTPKEVVQAAISKVLSGASLRQTRTWLQQETGVIVSPPTILRWVKHSKSAYKQFRKNQAEIALKMDAQKRLKEERRMQQLEERRRNGVPDGLSPKGHLRPPPKEVCPRCKSSHIIRHGLQYTLTEVVQIYHCKDCFRKWKASSTRFPRYRTPINVVIYADTRYFMHPTIQQIQKEIEATFHLKVSKTTIMRWIYDEKKHRAQLPHRNQVFPGLKATIDRLKTAAIQEDMNRS